MNDGAYVSIALGLVGMLSSWGIWVTVMVFELKAKIGLLKQEIDALKELKQILHQIREELLVNRRRSNH